MLCFGALIYAASVRPQAFLHKPVASLHAEAKAGVCLYVPTLSSVLHASGGCTTGLRSLREERQAAKQGRQKLSLLRCFSLADDLVSPPLRRIQL
ncbi:hypothetical protein QQF64_019034 [Cirrhinus molitorella]|uniref:Secreted protein n=1 Tax=Cirrhinus molitorella TaxID=172907 RepID=A0ABR3LIB4_9TELE